MMKITGGDDGDGGGDDEDDDRGVCDGLEGLSWTGGSMVDWRV